ncbi:lipoate--protein ligase [Olsenella sp. HMSC062G07]|uniref:lipoate--protein ligase n=1 Tax=Olsenella sp. HMSC062G07 TaxID=1739330 RepID=UPI0008A29BCC|nr:lipoate--protein ligase [Olsenella sp. HMSC062G07]OFK22292.1 hypothetical protein HMPREF2826_01965 [Olsenella sp. HMSC062G07]
MIGQLACLVTSDTDPYLNLAREELLLRRVRRGQCILYLWQNERTVVIGRNQSAHDECDVEALEADGGHLARRLSGGGAVYHDLGNLNFTFLVPTEDFDVARQSEVILRAVRAVGVSAERSGRNDLVACGRKFSGNAFYHSGGSCATGVSYHHGTLMVDVDPVPLVRYLRPSPLKLAAKGVASVRSRVVNLRELAGGLTTSALEDALVEAFGEVYGWPVTSLAPDALSVAELERRRRRLADDAWLFKTEGRLRRPRLPLSGARRFGWGTALMGLELRDGCITACELWSDGLDADVLERVPPALRGCALEARALKARLTGAAGAHEPLARDLVVLACQTAAGERCQNGAQNA